ncbi:UNVERIFIED_CONTAM: hypothetical protein Scaly_2762100 [Sesamum calycinum]|uniref:Tf2-1-like SH3-like domain-containing protein n=1 Tax=Sesamum calycinum TaxID=2727403 RepID=A0AAW2IZJ9_9LAMI
MLPQKWISKLLSLSYEVQDKKCNKNRAVDAMSRVEHEGAKLHSNAISTQIPLWMQEIQASYEGNTLFQTVIQAKSVDAMSFPDYEYKVGILRRGGLKAFPFQALYGYPPHQFSIGPYLYNHQIEVEELTQERIKVLQLLKENLHQAHHRLITYADEKRLEREFEVGGKVFLKLQPYRQTSVALRKQLKLSAKYFRPLSVIEKVGKVSYKLELPLGSKIQLVFHVSLLKKKVCSKYFPLVNLPEFEDEVFKVYPAAILA